MKAGVLVAQITDCHLAADPGRQYRGVNPHHNLKTLLKQVKAKMPDLILASGDLSEDGSRVSYEILKQYFDPLKIPVLALPGNHDDAGLLAEIFPGSPTGTPRVSEHGAWQIIRLNSCLPGKPEGRLDEKVLVELENILASDAGRPRLVALHHQPISTGSPWIDKYRLLEPEALLQVIDRYRDIKAVVWGHVHQAFEADRNGTVMLGGPSSAINCLPGAQKFSPDPNGPAFRWLDLRVDGTLLSKLMGNSQH